MTRVPEPLARAPAVVIIRRCVTGCTDTTRTTLRRFLPASHQVAKAVAWGQLAALSTWRSGIGGGRGIRWRCFNMVAKIEAVFRARHGERRVSELLKRLGFCQISARAPKASAVWQGGVQENFQIWQRLAKPGTPITSLHRLSLIARKTAGFSVSKPAAFTDIHFPSLRFGTNSGANNCPAGAGQANCRCWCYAPP